MNVREVMNSEPLIVELQTPLESAITRMTDTKSSCLLVVNGGVLSGIITERDLTQLLNQVIQGCDISKFSVADVMTPNPCHILETTSCEDALALSRSRKIRHIPVVNEQDELSGIVTQSNLLDAYFSLLSDNAELTENLELLKLQSLEDPLMKIGNRRAMEVDLNFTQAEALRHNQHFSVALIDIDYFKRFNDSYGHQAGDEALKAVANALKTAKRSSDRIYRYGGEEILMLMPKTSEEEALLFGERIRQAIESLALPNEGSPFGLLTTSVGVADSPIDNWSEMVERADKALYAAKDSGRNKVQKAS